MGEYAGDVQQVYTYDIHLQGGLRRGGLTPALAPRVPGMTGDVGKSRL